MPARSRKTLPWYQTGREKEATFLLRSCHQDSINGLRVVLFERHYARFTLAGLMPRLCPDAVGGKSGSTHPIHARPGPCRAGTPFTLATRPRIVVRSGSGVVFIMTPFPVYLFDSRRTCFVQHLRIQSFIHTLLFVFLFLCSSSSSSRRRRRRRIRTHAIKPNRAAATFLFFLQQIVAILINGYSNAGHYNHKYNFKTAGEHENESRNSWQVTHFQILYIFETSHEIAIVTVIGRDWLPCIIPL